MSARNLVSCLCFVLTLLKIRQVVADNQIKDQPIHQVVLKYICIGLKKLFSELFSFYRRQISSQYSNGEVMEVCILHFKGLRLHITNTCLLLMPVDQDDIKFFLWTRCGGYQTDKMLF